MQWHIGTLENRCAAMDFLAEFSGGLSSVAFAVLTAETHTHTENSEKHLVEKFGENIPFFCAFFCALFSVFFFGALFGEQLFALKSEKFAKSVLQETSLN